MKTTECACPRDECEGVVKVELEYEPPDSMYGADADGNRGIAVRGYWTADAVTACSLGHELTDKEGDALRKEAEEDAGSYDPTDDYDGPDTDREEDY